jgi:ATP-dependent helicase/nuclease subunit A
VRVDAAEPTYSRTSVTALTKAAGDPDLPRLLEGHGMAFGSVVHRCIDAIGGGLQPDRLEALAQMIAEEVELDVKWLPDAITIVRRVLESELWRRSHAAKQAYHEFSSMAGVKFPSASYVRSGILNFLDLSTRLCHYDKTPVMKKTGVSRQS